YFKFIWLCLILVNSLIKLNECIELKNRPLVAILSQKYYSQPSKSYIAASYVKFVESAGARVIPVMIDRDENYYRDIINKTNGLLIPGGGQDLLTSGYAKAGRLLWQLSTTEFKDRKYPIWGTCLGFELIIQFYANNTLSDCDAIDVSNSLTFVEPIQDSRLLQDKSIVEILAGQEVTYNYHKKCLTLETFNKTPELKKNLRLLSTNKDKKGLDYVSMFESINYPIYGVQWHPEKNPFEFAYNAKYLNIPHNSSAIKVSQYMSSFFVDECRKSVHPIVNAKEESDSLIYNYQPVYTGGKTNYTYEQIYLFNSHKPNHWSVSIGFLIITVILVLNLSVI
ncbi:unnamed protein product, partial [Oppiella nova]